jgi:hypothetical protein
MAKKKPKNGSGKKKRMNSVTLEAFKLLHVGIRDLTAAMGRGLSARRIGQLVSEGVLVKAARGRYPLYENQVRYAEYLQELVKFRETENEDGSVSGVSGERKRVLRMQGDVLEIELAQKRGLLIPLSVHVSMCSDLVLITRHNMLALESRLVPLVLGQDAATVRARVREETRRALSAMARFEIENCKSSSTEIMVESQPVHPPVSDGPVVHLQSQGG